MAPPNVSRDLQCIKHEAKIKIEKYLREDILFEYVRYMAGSNELTRHLWEIVQENDVTTRESFLSIHLGPLILYNLEFEM